MKKYPPIFDKWMWEMNGDNGLVHETVWNSGFKDKDDLMSTSWPLTASYEYLAGPSFGGGQSCEMSKKKYTDQFFKTKFYPKKGVRFHRLERLKN